MSSESFRYAATALLGIFQFVPLATDTLGGLSGNDSIARASLAALDWTSGLLLVFAMLNFSFPYDPQAAGRRSNRAPWYHIPRFEKLHSQHLDSVRGTQIRMTCRTNWRQLFTSEVRVADLYRLQVMSTT